MTPVVIPSRGGACFAVYGSAPGPAVLMCPPIGDEARKTARLWRDLAVDLRARGVASLRLDLPGTGNSSGEPTDPDLVEHWRAAIHASAEWLGQRHGGRVILFGYRFGALLALDAAADIRAEQLILLDPPISGTAAARYLRARARLGAGSEPPEGANYIQSGEMLLSKEALNAISALPAPMTRANAPAQSLLVLPLRAAATAIWRDRLASAGSRVEVMPFQGHEDFVAFDAFKATRPTAMLERLVEYVTQTAQPLETGSNPVQALSASLHFDDFSEEPIRFGSHRSLFGILCRPERARTDLPVILLPTTGVDPCYGMSRMWTDLARRLARQGVTTLRFDMGGVGESDGDLGANVLAAMYHEDRFNDLCAALDVLEPRGYARTIVVGYCSGAYAAWHAALLDGRIAGVLAANLLFLNRKPTQTEGILLAKPGSLRIGTRLGRLGRFLPKRSLQLLRHLDRAARRAVPQSIRTSFRVLESDSKETRRFVNALSARDCPVLIVMSRDDHGHLRLRRAYGDKPRLPSNFELKVIDGADHLFSDRRHRAQFLDLAAAFVLDQRADPVLVPDGPVTPRLMETAS